MVLFGFYRDTLWILMMKYDDDIEVHAETDNVSRLEPYLMSYLLSSSAEQHLGNNGDTNRLSTQGFHCKNNPGLMVQDRLV